MPFKKVSSGKNATEKIVEGINLVADSVAATLGPKGRNVYLYDPNIISTKITNDGVSIANKIILEDQEMDAGAFVIRNVSAAQLDSVGDGTSTASLLTQKIIQECLKRPENPMQVRESLKEASTKILKDLKKRGIGIKKEDIKKVALISAEDEVLATKITQIIQKLGEKAIINVEDSKTFETDFEIVDGYEAHVGFMSPHFINEKNSSKAIYENVLVFCTQKKISNIIDVKPLFDKLAEEKVTSLVIVCEDIEDSMLGIFVNNKMLGRMNTVVIRAQGQLLLDIAGCVGATLISDSTGVTFQNLEIEHLGKAKKVICDANKTLFIGNNEASKKYADNLEAQANGEPNQYTQKTMYNRVAKLRGGIAILRIGSATDGERSYLKDKADDAVKATLAALEEGVCEGGGMTFWRIAQAMNPKTVGEEILKKALVAPLKKIIENCGKDYTEVITSLKGEDGYNAKEDRNVNLIKEGIIDPHKVLRCAIENSVSSASSFITINSLITDVPDTKK